MYVAALVRELNRRGCEALVVAPGSYNQEYTFEDLRVRRYAVSQSLTDLRELYGEGDPVAAENFAAVLEAERPDLVHLHAFTSGVSLLVVNICRSRRIPVVFTYHTPAASCLRGTLMRWGVEPCAGYLDRRLCTQCVLHGLGVNRTAAWAGSRIPPGVGGILGRFRLQGGLWTALRMSDLVRLRQACVHSLWHRVDRIVAVCGWVKDLVLANGVQAPKVVLCRQGLPCGNGEEAENELTLEDEEPLRVAYLGRLDASKGPDILIEAMKQIPALRIELDIYGIPQGLSGESFLQVLKNRAAGDKRIQFCQPVSPTVVSSLLRKYHLLAIPSRCLETGPMVALDAFAGGTPVLGSKLGGIAELVEHDVNGILVEVNSVSAWAGALARCRRNPGLITTLRQGVRPPRTMRQVANDMREIYSDALSPVTSVAQTS